MNRFVIRVLVILILLCTESYSQSQPNDKASFTDKKNECWDDIKTSSDKFKEIDKPVQKVFRMDFSGYDLPESKDEFKQQWHHPPISQGRTGTCWCFATSSFVESEVYRRFGRKIKLSEIYTVYWEYVEKASRFVRERGDSHLGEGSLANTVMNKWEKYGCVPADAYSGLLEGQKYHDHSALFKEIKSYLKSVKERNAWNEDEVISTVKEIMNHYFGKPPTEFEYEGKKMTPTEFYNDVVKVKSTEYVDLISLLELPNWKQGEYDVPDNWWNSDIYYNIPLDDYMGIVKKSIQNGYTLLIGGDVSESGYDGYAEVGMIPSYDIPSDYIDEYARQFRFSNGSTTDDHAIHIIGYQQRDGVMWFLIKDSGSGSRNGKNVGYYFYHEDYIKLKIMNVMLPKEAVADILTKFDK